MVDEATGEFIKEGNVFTDGKTKNVSKLKTISAAHEKDPYSIYSLDVTETKPKEGQKM